MNLNERFIHFMVSITTGKIGIIIEEFIRAVAGWAVLGYVLYFIGGKLGWAEMTSCYITLGIVVATFSILVPLRIKTGLRFQLARFRRMLVFILVIAIPIFIWRLVEGEVAQAFIFAAVMAALTILLRMSMKRRGLE